jgi:hypothetical protein
MGIAIFNSLNWSRGGVVRVPATRLRGEFTLVDPTTGAEVLYEREGGEIVLVAPPAPACGFLVLHVHPGRSGMRAEPSADWQDRMFALHTEDYTLQFHKAGGLARWHDRARSSQWCSDDVEFPMGTYLYEMPGGEQLRDFARKVHSNSHAVTPGYFQRHDYDEMPHVGPAGGRPARVTCRVSGLLARVIIEAECPPRRPSGRRSGDAQRYRSTFTVYRGRRELHVRLELFGKRPTFAAEAGYAFFPFSGEKPSILINRIAHQLDPRRELAGRVNAAHMAVGRGVRIQHTHAGMNFYPLHTPLVSFGRPGLYRFDENGKHESGVLYATLFNNGWGTNFAQWQKGDFAFDFVLQPTGNDAGDGGLERGGAEAFRPLVAQVIEGRPASPAGTMLNVEPSRSVQVVTVKPAEWDSGTVMRLWNADANPAGATLRFPIRRGAQLWRCDLLERRKDRIRISLRGEAKLKLRPNEIATLLLM